MGQNSSRCSPSDDTRPTNNCRGLHGSPSQATGGVRGEIILAKTPPPDYNSADDHCDRRREPAESSNWVLGRQSGGCCVLCREELARTAKNRKGAPVGPEGGGGKLRGLRLRQFEGDQFKLANFREDGAEFCFLCAEPNFAPDRYDVRSAGSSEPPKAFPRSTVSRGLFPAPATILEQQQQSFSYPPEEVSRDSRLPLSEAPSLSRGRRKASSSELAPVVGRQRERSERNKIVSNNNGPGKANSELSGTSLAGCKGGLVESRKRGRLVSSADRAKANPGGQMEEADEAVAAAAAGAAAAAAAKRPNGDDGESKSADSFRESSPLDAPEGKIPSQNESRRIFSDVRTKLTPSSLDKQLRSPDDASDATEIRVKFNEQASAGVQARQSTRSSCGPAWSGSAGAGEEREPAASVELQAPPSIRRRESGAMAATVTGCAKSLLDAGECFIADPTTGVAAARGATAVELSADHKKLSTEQQQQPQYISRKNAKLLPLKQLSSAPDSSQPKVNNNHRQPDFGQHLNWKGLTSKYNKMPAHRQDKSRLWWQIRQSCLCNTLLSALHALFPILGSFKCYSLPGDLVTDAVAGFTIAVLHIPQGMAYGLLAGVEPIYGLYVSFVPVFVMAIMSKSRHVSYGTFAVISMLLASATDSVKRMFQQQAIASMAEEAASRGGSTPAPEVAGQPRVLALNKRQVLEEHLESGQRSLEPIQQLIKNLYPFPEADNGHSQETQQSFSVKYEPATSVLQANFAAPLSESFSMPSNMEILGAICVVVGVIQITMSLMRLGVLSLMFSDQLVSSFTTASAVHVVTSQLGSLFDLTLPHIPDGLFKVCRTWWVFGTKLLDGINQHTAVLSISSILFLLLVKELAEPLLRRRYKSVTCLPSELVLMAVVIFSSWYWNFNETYNIKIIGMVPTGLPAFQAPRLDLYHSVLQDALTIALVSFAMNLSLGQVYAKRFRYKLNPNQELFALGSANLVSSFFSCFPCASSLSRSAVQSNLNVKSQLAALFSCALVVSIICYFAPILHDLPRSTLSCIIIVALKGILVQVTDLYENWRLSKLDAFVWVLTFLSVLAFGVTYGLVLGIVASLFMIFFRLLTPNHSILGQLPGTEIYIDKNAFLDCEEISQIKIFRFNSALCYLNRTMFKSSVEKSLPSIYKQNSFASLFCSTLNSSSGSSSTIRPGQYYDGSSLDYDNKIRFLIIDCSALAYCDYSGAATLVEIIEELDEHKVTVYLAACPLKLIGMIEKMQKTNVIESNVYPSITDAVNHAKYLRNCTPETLTISSSAKYSPNSLKSVLDDGIGSSNVQIL